MCFAFSPLPLNSSSAQNLSKINAMINQLVVESLTVYTKKEYIICIILYQIILKSAIQIRRLPKYRQIQVYSFKIWYVESADFIILFCSLGGSISRNSGTLKCWNEVHQYCSARNKTSFTMYTFNEHVQATPRYMPIWLVNVCLYFLIWS